MGKLTEKVRSFFQAREQRKREALIEDLKRYEQPLQGYIENFTKKAQEAELSGKHEEALEYTRLIMKLQCTLAYLQFTIENDELQKAISDNESDTMAAAREE